jgi:NADPH:quinone reductase-like Zn-dependent oxidoreductase
MSSPVRHMRHFMKAIVCTQYGPPDVLQFAEVAKPSPKDNEVLIKLYAASVNPLDLFHMRGAPWNRRVPGLRTPKQPVIGCDIAGRVEAVGQDVKQFQSGDDIFGVTGFAGGGFAEYPILAVCARVGHSFAGLYESDCMHTIRPTGRAAVQGDCKTHARGQ